MGNVAVYKKGTTDFFSQGLGLLSDVVSSNLTQTASSTGNVEQKLEVEYPIDGYLVSELVEGAILRVSVSTDKSDYGVFEIVDTLKDDSGTITVYGDPYYNRILRMSFDNGGVFTKFSSVQSALNAAKQNITGFPADFNLISNLSTSVDLSANTYDTFGTFLEALNSAVHGNIKYSLNGIQIYSALGKDITDITLRDDMNTSSVKITTDFSGIINKVIPVLPVLDKDGNATDQTKVGTIVTSKYSNQFLDYWAGKVIQFDTQDLANTYFDRTNADRPVQTVDVDPIGLDDDFSTINIFDTIELYSTRLDYTDKLRVSERVFDTLAENVTSFKLGSSSVNIFNQINEQNNEIFNNVVKLTNAAISANGKGIDYFGQAQPSSPKEGDTWFWDDGTDFGIKQYTNGEWVDLAGSNTAEKIANAVTDAVLQAKSHTDEVKQGLSTDIATAKSQATSQASTAEANAKSEAVSQFNQAQNALSAAKTDLTNSIASEASARNQAVAAANSQAQSYANQAKADAMSAASSADGVIRTAISSSADSLSATITQNKSSTDSGISTAQATAKAAVDGLELKISKTDYDQKTGDLSTKINDVKHTADSSAQTIADIQKADGKQDARMAEIENTASGLKSTVSDLQTTQGKQSGDISTLQQRADGFEATVTKVDNLSVGGRNYILNSNISTTSTMLWLYSSVPSSYFNHKKITVSVQLDYDNITALSGQKRLGVEFVLLNKDGSNKYIGSWKWPAVGDTFHGRIYTTWDCSNDEFKDYVNNQMGEGMYVLGITGTNVSVSKPKLEIGTSSTDWTPAPEDVDSATAKIKLTADEASAAVTKLTSADGVITKAQADIKANSDAITEKVSKTVYDQKTGDLTQAISKAQSTADGAVSTVGNYQTSNDKRVSDAESKIEQNAKDITARVTQTDYDKKTGELSENLSTLKQRADGFEATVTKVNNLSVGGRNLFLGTKDFSGDGNWTIGGDLVKDVYQGLDAVQTASEWSGPKYNNSTLESQGVIQSVNDTFIMSAWVRNTGTTEVSISYFNGFTNNNDQWVANLPANSGWIRISSKPFKFKQTSNLNGTMRFEPVTNPTSGYVQQAGLKLEKGNIATDYTQAPEDTATALVQVKITADSISNFLRDSSGNISSDFQTALSKTSIITGSTLASSIQKQTSSQISSALTDNNGKIISLINQDTSGVQIAGKNIVLDGDTTVTGDFYAKGGNFKNLNASNLTVGTLNGSQVNITNVNVNSLVGNVSSFIQSNWNGKYSSTTITELGMTIGDFSKYGYDTTFDKTGMTFTTKEARYNYAKSHFGINKIVSDSDPNYIVGYGTEISFGTPNGVGFDYFAIVAPGASNLKFGSFTAPGHISMAITGDKALNPFFGAGINMLDDVFMKKGMTVSGDMFVNTIQGANAFNLFNIIKGQRICIPTSFSSNGTAEKWLSIQM
ncbi:gp58-like family protein [Leuconostoc falkenbergense]|uniref:gp58-like family protein n=1 Tax=Leuconostoc falkenbergense TaxID=2766470 RepID=UPI002A832018|nr:gp58-like family protein [Leuconostoc falkenbergense]MDY5164480.1 gp58-like family protein [Leuconostoc falkenbergense]